MFFWALAGVMGALGHGGGPYPQEGGLGGGRPRVLVARLGGELTEASERSFEERVLARLDADPQVGFLIVRLAAREAEIDAAKRLALFLGGELRGVRTVAWVPEDIDLRGPLTVAALAAHELIAGPGARFGDIPPEMEGVLLEVASRRGRPTALLRSMVTRDHDDVVEVTYRRPQGRIAELERRYYFARELDALPAAEKVRIQGRRIVVPRGRLYEPDDVEAKEHGLVAAVVPDREGVEGILVRLGIAAAPQDIIDLESGALRPGSGQTLVDFFNHPFVRFLLILGGCLGILLEIKMLGSVIPGLIGLACFAVFFVTSALPTSGSVEGTANLFEIALFVIGAGLLALELFVTPGVAVFGLVGAAMCAISLVLAMVPPQTPYLSHQMGFKEAVTVLVVGFGAGALCFLALLRFLPRTRFFGRGGLVTHAAIEGVATADSAIEAQSDAADLVGRQGIVETGLRPAGKIVLDDGRLLDVVAEGEFIPRGERVRIVEATSTRIVVRRMEPEGGTAGNPGGGGTPEPTG